MEITKNAIEKEFETYRFSNIKYSSTSFEGRVMLNFDVRPVKEVVNMPAGAYWVSMKQRRSRLILAMLEPAAPDSLAKWGFCDAVFEGLRGGDAGEYLAEPIARRMMTESPELRKQFEQKVAADASFEGDAQARLQWWYRQSKYEAGDAGRYPVVRVWEKTW